MTDDELKIFKRIMSEEDYERALYSPNSKGLDYRPYFEKPELDLFLDYFGIYSNRNHWTTSGTSGWSREEYTKEMKHFCNCYGLPFKDVYNRRHMGNDVDDAQS